MRLKEGIRIPVKVGRSNSNRLSGNPLIEIQ